MSFLDQVVALAEKTSATASVHQTHTAVHGGRLGGLDHSTADGERAVF